MSFFSLGVFVATRGGMIGQPIRYSFNKIIEFLFPQSIAKYIKKPLFECPPCMASVWGGGLYFIVYGLDLNFIVCVFICSFLNKLLVPYVE